jgi:hypothetical protein
VLFPFAVLAQVPATSSQRGPGFVQLGPIVAYPGLDLQVGYNDNLYLRPANVVGSSLSVISPYLRLEYRRGGDVYDLIYRSEFTRYHDAPADSSANHMLQANAKIVFDARHDMRLRAELRSGSDPRGSTDRAISSEPDAWRQTSLFGMYGYGAAGNPGRLEFDGSWTARSYSNNRATTAAADRASTDLGATFFWRIAPKTRVLLQARRALIDYDQDGSTFTSTETRYLVGAQWEATVQTTGYAKFGWMDKTFENGGSRTQSGASWDLGVRWSPLSYSVLDVSALRTFVESTGLGDTIISSRTNAAWTHAWNSRLNHNLYWSRINDDFVGGGATRLDESTTLGLKFNYQFQRWLKLGAEIAHTERDSNDAIFRYRRNLLLFTVGGTL